MSENKKSNKFSICEYKVWITVLDFTLMIELTKISVLLCVCSVDIASSESFLRGGDLPTLTVQSTGHSLHVFVNGQLSGE